MKALLLGSISVLSDTSEMQRSAFNDAFHEAGLDWYWSRDDYRKMLRGSGGHDRIAAFSELTGEHVDSAALHAHKTEIFQGMLRRSPPELRSLTAQVLSDAKRQGLMVGFISGTSRKSIEALLDGLGGAEALGIDFVTSADDAEAPKPDPALYRYALNKMNLSASDAIAVEDNKPGVAAAIAAGLPCYVYPNANTLEHDFGSTPHLSELSLLRAA